MRKLSWLLLACVALAQTPQDVVNQVSQPNYAHYLLNLLHTHTGDNRGALFPQHDDARNNILETFASFGLTATLDPFDHQGGTFNNVVAVLPGKTRPFEYHVAGAHYDSKDNPGADDDASGVAGLLEAARVLSMHDFETSIVFIAFDREEAGLAGSRAWAAEFSAWRILSMLQLDMIGFNPPGPYHNLLALVLPVNASNPIYTAVEAAVRQYSGGLIPVNGGVSNRSDHYAFANLAPSLMLIEAGFSANTDYHKPTDAVETPGLVDFSFAAGVTRSTAGYLATAAGLLPQFTASTVRFSAAGVANAAGWTYGAVAPGEIVSLTGSGLSGAVTVRDSTGAEHTAPTLYASPSQVNIVLPETLATGAATIAVAGGASAQVRVAPVAPGLFTANANGMGPAAAQAVRVAPDGTQTMQDLFVCEAVCTAAPVDFGEDRDRVVLVLYATGVRGRSGLAGVTVEAGGEVLPVEYAGAQPTFPGLDQVNAELPRSLRGRGIIRLILRVDGNWSNPVEIDTGPAS